MCLEVNDGVRIPEIATEDIICYKVIKKVGKFYETPYKYMPVKMKGKYKSILDDPLFYQVDRGFHSFANKEAAEIELQYWYNTTSCYNCMIAECIIPKGAFYYKREFDRLSSYASDKINYIKII